MEYSDEVRRHKRYMGLLTKVAQEVLRAGKEMPIITLLEFQDRIISMKYNKTNEHRNGIHHGEYLSFKNLPTEFLEKHKDEITLYVNVEPCIMCDGMIKLAGVNKVVFSCENDRFGSSLLPAKIKNDSKLKCIPFIYRKEAIVTLRQFYLQENKNAPKTRRKEGRSLDLETFPALNWSAYFPTFDEFYKTMFNTSKTDEAVAMDIYTNNKDLEPLDPLMIKPDENENFEATILENCKTFWDEWREPKKAKTTVDDL